MKFRKKPVEIEAMQFKGITFDVDYSVEFDEWVTERAGDRTARYINSETIIIETLEGDMIASAGDWIICGVEGELYPCKPDIFEKTYEPVDI